MLDVNNLQTTSEEITKRGLEARLACRISNFFHGAGSYFPADDLRVNAGLIGLVVGSSTISVLPTFMGGAVVLTPALTIGFGGVIISSQLASVIAKLTAPAFDCPVSRRWGVRAPMIAGVLVAAIAYYNLDNYASEIYPIEKIKIAARKEPLQKNAGSEVDAVRPVVYRSDKPPGSVPN